MTDNTKRQNATPKWQELELGAEIIYHGSSKALKTGDWSSTKPVWSYYDEKTGCVQCGVCLMYCPEGCIHMKPLKETNFDLSKIKSQNNLTVDSLVPVADYYYCKGCGICARECWTGCIKMTSEE